MPTFVVGTTDGVHLTASEVVSCRAEKAARTKGSGIQQQRVAASSLRDVAATS